MLDQLEALVPAEAPPGGLQHGLGHVDPHAHGVGTVGAEQGEQPAVTRAQVEDPGSAEWYVLEQHGLALAAVGEPVGSGEIALGVLLCGPFRAGHAGIIAPRRLR